MTLSLLTVAGRLVHLQVVKAETFEDLGARQRVRRVELPAKRGSILDRNGSALAMSVDARAIYANPHFVTDAAGTAKAISPGRRRSYTSHARSTSRRRSGSSRSAFRVSVKRTRSGACIRPDRWPRK
jgi:cell division protein FtsI/penicillin-binding protein 2